MWNSILRPRILNVYLIITWSKLWQQYVPESNPVTEIFLTKWTKWFAISIWIYKSYQKLCHYLAWLAIKWIHSRIVGFTLNMDILCYRCVKTILSQRTIIPLFVIIAIDVTITIVLYQEIQKALFKGINVYEESTIILCKIRYLSFHKLRPARITLAPRSCILLGSPWILYLEKAVSYSFLVFDCINTEDGESMRLS